VLRIGLTGGLGAGKSTVARLLGELGAAVFDADAIVRELYAPGGAGEAAARELFGDAVVGPDGRVDRSRLAGLVFSDPARRHALEARIHPLVGAEIERRFASAEHEGAAVAAAEASQLLEAKTDARYDRVVLVTAPEPERIRRWEAKGGDPEDARRRMAGQLPAAAARLRAHDVLVNDGDVEALRGRVRELWESWSRAGLLRA
jgi:dephospho-CoA kinase